jgi:3-deoxy-D-manno-octulosonate 8-phosphate phosphatase (KDO 8-P phosphatase)
MNTRIKLFIMDVDGTLTDGKIYIGNSGEIFKAFNVKDGLGVNLLKKNNVIPAIITGRTSDIVLVRAKELGIQEVHQGVEDKVEVFNILKEKYNLTNDQIAFVGDDLNDLELIKLAGLKLTVANAAEELFDVVDYKSSLNGGEGAVRDIINKLLAGKI